jgi:hypothetical protein
MHERPDYLFEGTSVFTLIQHTQTHAMAELKAQNENIILSAPTDDLVARVLATHTFHIPELRDSETWVDEKEVTNEVPIGDYDFFTDRRGGTRTVTSHIVSFHVPFDGDWNLFKIEPSNRTIPGPAAAIKGQELIIKIATDRKTPEHVKAGAIIPH